MELHGVVALRQLGALVDDVTYREQVILGGDSEHVAHKCGQVDDEYTGQIRYPI